jgi:heme/copper-type cytochrome/quinol oxidase subunit 2
LDRRFLIIGVVVVALVAVGVYYSFVASSSSAIIVRLVTTNPPAQGGLILPQNERRSWDPAVIELRVGEPVTIVMVNNDDIELHQFSIPDLGVETEPVAPFESTSIEFTPTMTGNFTFIDPRPQETYSYTDYRGVDVNQVVDHSVETGVVIVRP